MNSLLIDDVLAYYRSGAFTLREVLSNVLDAIESAPQRHVWITRLSRERVMEFAAALVGKSPDSLPLYGVPFAIKDNIDLAGVPTTAGCPEFAYVPQRSATVVQKLIDAGAIPIGKTNLDQFATGLVGTRSPYGACRNSFNSEFISGGSSSGSAVAVAAGLVSFALGTDTAGSGRVPAAFNNLIGMKPSCGELSTTGMVPACRSLDCMSIFALSAGDAHRVFQVARGHDVEDAYSHVPGSLRSRFVRPSQPGRFGVPRREQLEFVGDTEYARLFDAACVRMETLGWQRVEVDLAPFLETARLLYEGPWVAERHAALAGFLAKNRAAMHPITRQIVERGAAPSASDLFAAQHRLMDLKRATANVWSDIEMLFTPTAPSIFRLDEEARQPIALNSQLGYYTNFVNLLDLAAVAVPAGFRTDGMPFGVTLVAPASCDVSLLNVAADLQFIAVSTVGATNFSVPRPVLIPDAGYVNLVVCGAHMDGLPLNHQLRTRGARHVRTTRTSVDYCLFALPGGPPQRPGLMRVKAGGGAIEVEVWSIPEQHFASLVAGIPAPLGIGKIELEDGSLCSGFLCESHAVENALEITQLGGWRAYLKEQAAYR